MKYLDKFEKKFNKIKNKLYLKPFKYNEPCILPKGALFFGVLYHQVYGPCFLYYNKKPTIYEISYNLNCKKGMI